MYTQIKRRILKICQYQLDAPVTQDTHIQKILEDINSYPNRSVY